MQQALEDFLSPDARLTRSLEWLGRLALVWMNRAVYDTDPYVFGVLCPAMQPVDPPPLIDPLNRTNLTSPTSLINSDPSPLRYYNPLTITPF